MEAPPKRYWKWIAVATVLVALFVASRFLPFGEWISAFTDWVRDFGPWGVVLFMAGYVVAVVCFFPGSMLTITAGLAFGVLWGAAIALTSATLGATLAFLVARYFARGWVARRTQDSETFRAIDAAIGKQDWKVIGLLRLSPLVPFNLSNYFFGVTRARLWAYVAASFVGMMPGAVLYAYLGHLGKAVLGEEDSESSTVRLVFLGVGLIATAVVTWLITRVARQELGRLRGHEARRLSEGDVGDR